MSATFDIRPNGVATREQGELYLARRHPAVGNAGSTRCATGARRYPGVMRTALDAPTETLDEHERSFVASIREHGWFRTSVFAEEGQPGFSYTTGFWHNTGLPELIVFGLKNEIAHDVLWELFSDAQAGFDPAFAGDQTDLTEDGWRAALS